MKILYIYRHPDMGFSIGKVFRPIEEEMKIYAEVDSIYLPVANYSLNGLWRNIRYAQKACINKRYDIVHITGNEHYLIPFLLSKRHKVIVTVHDLGSIYVHNPIINFIKKLLFIQTLRLSSVITCISEKTKEEVTAQIPNNGNIITIYNPINKDFQYTPQKFNENNPLVLHIGTKPNKNLENTVKALSGINCQMRIIGKLSTSQINILEQCNILYTNDFALSDEQIWEEYKKCDIVNFPSLYEGFGMPIIEGQAIGRVVITSDLSPMKEVAGNAAILVDPSSIESLKDGYKKAIKNNAIFIKKGLENVKRFQLSEIAKQYFQIYK